MRTSLKGLLLLLLTQIYIYVVNVACSLKWKEIEVKKKLEVFMFMHVHKYLCNVFTPKPDVIIKVASIHSMMTSSGGIIKL